MKKMGMGHRLVSLVLSLLLLYLCNVVAQVTEGDALTELSLSGQSGYIWGKGYPQSCVCAETNVASNLCDQFKCKCTCDITAGKCDYSCCCDPDCTANQINRFKSLDVCLPEGATPDSEQMCYNTQELEKVNPRAPLGGESAAARAVNELLCVTKTNHYRLGEYFEDVSPYSGGSVFETNIGKKGNSYKSDTVLYETDSYYDQNDTIPAYGDAGATKSLGPFPLPSVDFSGTCNDKSLGLFENPTLDRSQVSGRSLWEHGIGASQECTRLFSTDANTFTAQCTNSQSLAKYVTSLYIAKKSDSSELDGSNTVGVTLGTILFQDSITGIITDVTSSFNSGSCDTSSVAGNVYGSSPTCVFNSNSTVNTMKAAATGSAQVCTNVVKSVAYEIKSSQSNTYSISEAKANVVLTDVASVSDYRTLRQSFSLDFYDDGDSTASSTEGNLITRPRSGNPGYLMGAPVVFGKAGATAGTIDAYVGGFKIPSSVALFGTDQSIASANPSTCPTNSQIPGSTQVPFGYDISSGCTLSLTRDQLEDLCCEGSSGCSGDSVYSDSNGLPYFFNTGEASSDLSYILAGYVGIFGNADPLDSTQWIPITVEAPNAADSKTWNSATGTCANMYSQMNIEFLVAKTGEKLSPQNKIVAAIIRYSTAEWKTSVVAGDTVTTQNFNLGVTVSFVFTAHNEIIGYVPPPPPVLFKVPYDVFYPFTLSSPAPRTSTVSMMAFVLPMILMISFMYNF